MQPIRELRSRGRPSWFQSSTRLTRFATGVIGNALRTDEEFQSSTRLTRFATQDTPGVAEARSLRFQSSTRLTRFATAPSRKRLQAGGLEAIFARGGIMRQPGREAVGLKWDFPSPGRVRTRTRGKNKYAIQKNSLLYSKNPRFGTGGLHKVAFALARRSRGPRGASTPRGRCARCVPPPPGARSTPLKRPPPC